MYVSLLSAVAAAAVVATTVVSVFHRYTRRIRRSASFFSPLYCSFLQQLPQSLVKVCAGLPVFRSLTLARNRDREAHPVSRSRVPSFKDMAVEISRRLRMINTYRKILAVVYRASTSSISFARLNQRESAPTTSTGRIVRSAFLEIRSARTAIRASDWSASVIIDFV